MSYTVVEHEGTPFICVFFTPDLYDQVAKDLEFTRKKKEQNRAYAPGLIIRVKDQK